MLLQVCVDLSRRIRTWKRLRILVMLVFLIPSTWGQFHPSPLCFHLFPLTSIGDQQENLQCGWKIGGLLARTGSSALCGTLTEFYLQSVLTWQLVSAKKDNQWWSVVIRLGCKSAIQMQTFIIITIVLNLLEKINIYVFIFNSKIKTQKIHIKLSSIELHVESCSRNRN